jgi:hypothetical protein
MQTTVVTIASDRITDWDSFHSVFKAALGFPEFYGCNMNAWTDCMTDIDDPSGGMTNVVRGDLVALRIDDAPAFEQRCPEQYRALIECTAFVNYRRVEVGKAPVLTLMLSGWFQDRS